MNDRSWSRLKGLKDLLHDGVNRGADFVEKHHRRAADKPFDALESIGAPVAAPTRIVRSVHHGVLTVTYESIRTVNRLTERADEWLLKCLRRRRG